MTAPTVHIGAEASAVLHAYDVAFERYVQAETRRFDALINGGVSREMYEQMRDRVSMLRDDMNAARVALINVLYRSEER